MNSRPEREVCMTVEMIPADREAAADFFESWEFGPEMTVVKLAKAFARHRIAHQGDVPVFLEEWLERRVYKGSDEYRSYLSARFPRTGGAPSTFDFDGHKWAYYVTSFDDKGEYDVIRRRVPKAATPTPTVKDSLTGDVDELVERITNLQDGNAWPSTIELINDMADKLTELAAEVERFRGMIGDNK